MFKIYRRQKASKHSGFPSAAEVCMKHPEKLQYQCRGGS